MEIRILGPVEVVHGGRAIAIASRHQRALLALLVVHAGRPVSTERILDALWGGAPPESGAGSVAFHVSKLRAALRAAQDGTGGSTDGPGQITTEPGGYSLRVAPDAIDSARFERLARDGRARFGDDPGAAAEILRDALALWRGEPFEDLADHEFLAPEIARLDELRLRAHEDRFEADLALGHGREIVEELDVLVAAEPLREHLRGQLMRALYAAGRQADALGVFEQGRRLLADELGIDPSPELQGLQLAMLRQDASLGPTAVVGREPRNPYKGLRPFREADAPDFFGRERYVERLVDHLEAASRAGGLLLLVGPSGSGKSSVIRAGLLPALRARPADEPAWRVAVMLPGSRPTEALCDALGGEAADVATALTRAAAAGRGRLLLVIDQLEELFALAADPAEPARFLRGIAAALTGPPPRPVVVASLRADWLDRPLLSAELGPLVRDGIEVVAPLARDELERAIVRPAAAVGVELEPRLVAELVADVLDQPGALPLLQFALTELFERADGRRVGRAAYEAIGGVAAAVGRRAEAVYASLDDPSRAVARQLFLRLAAVGDGRSVSVRRVTVDDLRSIEPTAERVDAVLEEFGRSRLLAFDRDPRTGRATVEPAHEALLTHWPRLAGWIQDAEEALWMQDRLAATAVEWAASDRDPGFLLTGSRLDLYQAWSAGTDIRLDALERELLDASLSERRRAQAAERKRLDQERRLERRASTRLRALVAVLLAGVVGVSGLLAVVWRQAESARENQAIATARELAVAANGRLDTDPTLALLLAAESARATAERGWITEEALDALHWAVQEARLPYPADGDLPAAARLGPAGSGGIGGVRGVYLLPASDLVALAETGAGRHLTDAECLAYLHLPTCPVTGRDRDDVDLEVMTDSGAVAMAELAIDGLPGAGVRILSQLPVDLTGALTGYAASGPAVTIAAIDPGTDPRAAVERADVAILARPGDVADLARTGSLFAVDDILPGSDLAGLEALPLSSLGWVGSEVAGVDDGTARHVGVPLAATASSLLWYPADAFATAGYEPPASWDELDQLVARMIEDGRTPWCLGLVGGERDGASGADLIEDLVLDRSSSSYFNKWAAGMVSWEGFTIEQAYRRFGALAGLDGAVLGGPEAAVRTPATWSALQMGSGELPDCWLIHAGGDQRSRWEGPVRDDLTPVRLPVRRPDATDLRGRVYTLVILRDRPEVRELVRHLLSGELGSRLIASDRGSGLVPLTVEAGSGGRAPRELTMAGAVEAAIRDGSFSADASDRMPPAVGGVAFPDSVVRIAQVPTDAQPAAISREISLLEQARREGLP